MNLEESAQLATGYSMQKKQSERRQGSSEARGTFGGDGEDSPLWNGTGCTAEGRL